VSERTRWLRFHVPLRDPYHYSTRPLLSPVFTPTPAASCSQPPPPQLNLTEARLILIDSQLFFWLAASLATAQWWWRRQNEASLAEEAYTARTGREYDYTRYADAGDGRLMTVAERVAWVVAVGVTTSSAISIKFTGLATPGEYCARARRAWWHRRRPVSLRRPLSPQLLLPPPSTTVYRPLPQP
jgi:hypothetical protein